MVWHNNGMVNRNCRIVSGNIIDDFFQIGTHGNFDQTGVVYVTSQGEGLGTGAVGSTHGTEPFVAVQDDLRNVGVGFYIIQNGGLVEQTVFYGARRLNARHASVPFDGSGQSRTFTANEGTGTLVDMYAEAEVRTQNVIA